ncbi:unnamed protein product [Lota lota]
MEGHRGQVGNSVTIQCSDWKVWSWTDVTSNDKYLCRYPCEDILIQAGSQQTARKDRIHLNNTGHHLIVTMTNLQKEDSGTYVCGVEESGKDSYKTFDLDVEDVVTTPMGPTDSTPTTMKPTTTVVPDVFTTNHNPSTYYPLSDGTTSQIDGKAIASTVFLPCLLAGIVIMVALCLLIFIKCRNRKPRTIKSDKPVDEATQEVSSLYVNYKEDVKWRQRDHQAVKGKSSTTLELQEDLYANGAFTNQCKMQNKYTHKHTPHHPTHRIYNN